MMKLTGMFRSAVAMIFFTTLADGMAKVHLPVPYMSQPDDQTCFPTSMMMAINYYGRIDSFTSDTIQQLHKYCQYNRFNAPEVAKQFGLYALPNWHNLGWTPETVKHELDMGHPVVLGVNSGRSGHFILAIGYTDDNKVIVHDPSRLPDDVREWKDLLWRGGVILRPEPFPEPPPLSGVAVGSHGDPLEWTKDLDLLSEEDAEVSFTLVNNGRIKWPEKLFLAPVDPDSSPTKSLDSSMENGWLAPDLVMKVPALEPGSSTTLNFRVKATSTEKTTTVLQYFNLHDDQGNWFGTHWQTGPGHRNIGVRLTIFPKDKPAFKMPLVDLAGNGKPGLAWEAKYGEVKVDSSLTTPSPSNTPILHLLTPGEDLDSAWVGDRDWTDYTVSSWVYCDLRISEKANGWDRVGIFARDNGQHRGPSKTELETGYNILMAFDSDDGTIRAGDTYYGAIGDFRSNRYKLKESGWHHFAITVKNNTAIYELDGQPFHKEEKVRGHKKGDCGVFYQSRWKDGTPVESEPRGIYFSEFQVKAE